jgi:4-diphosphocytidyl-2-C-methyl-D-erythritol kinase
LTAYAKVNLGLYVDHLRSDGYHEIETIMTTVGISDRVKVSMIASGIEVMTVPSLDVPEKCNLAYVAASKMKRLASDPGGIRIEIHKGIPVAAGLGGGSADAAATIVGLDRLWNMMLSAGVMEEAAAEVGSDVPFLLHGGFALATSRGERLEPIGCGCEFAMAVISPRIPIRAEWAYKRARRGLTPSRRRIRLLKSGLTGGDIQKVAENLINDLEPGISASFPVVEEAKRCLDDAGALGSIMSGSGPSVIGIFEREEEAREIASKLVSSEWDVFVTKPVLPR